MPLPNLPAVWRIAITRGGGATISTNVIHVTSASLSGPQVATALNGAVTAGMWDAMLATATETDLVLTKLDGVTPSFEQHFSGANWAGTALGDVSPASAPVITFKTGQRGRRHTGRMYLGLVGEDKIGNGSVLGASVTVMQAAWTAFIANATSAGIPLTVASYGKTSNPPDPVHDFPPSAIVVATASVQALLGTQRRRQSRLRG